MCSEREKKDKESSKEEETWESLSLDCGGINFGVFGFSFWR